MVSTVGPVSKVNPSRVSTPGPAAGHLLALDHGDGVAAAGEVAGGGQAGQARPDDDDLVHELCFIDLRQAIL